MRARIVLGAAAVLSACAATPEAGRSMHAAPRSEWAEIAVDDLHFIRATLRENHPGPKDAENPWFRDWYEQGFAEAMRLAYAAEARAGYHYAIKRYMVGFQDGHLGARGESGELSADLEQYWPGFTAGYANGAFVVAEAEPGSGVAPGDRLLSCDGRSADELGETILQRFVGLWSVTGARVRYAPHLFIDQGNPFVARPQSCVFERDGEEVAASLEWRPIDFDAMNEKLASARQAVRPPIGVRDFGDGGKWVTLSSFNLGDDDIADSLRDVIDRLNADAAAIRGASVLVFDVRGNTGGSSTVGREAASAVWGAEHVAAVTPSSEGVDWRASAGNARFLRQTNLARYESRFGADDPRTLDYAEFVDAYDAAVAAGEAYYAERWGGDDDDGAYAAPEPVTAKVFFLTDGFCGSACLNFADTMTRIEGVTHVGRETSADAIYIDNRGERLPSGLGWVGFSMKVYRGRPRGHNESYAPENIWTGDMTDDAGLEAWILELATQSD